MSQFELQGAVDTAQGHRFGEALGCRWDKPGIFGPEKSGAAGDDADCSETTEDQGVSSAYGLHQVPSPRTRIRS